MVKTSRGSLGRPSAVGLQGRVWGGGRPRLPRDVFTSTFYLLLPLQSKGKAAHTNIDTWEILLPLLFPYKFAESYGGEGHSSRRETL